MLVCLKPIIDRIDEKRNYSQQRQIRQVVEKFSMGTLKQVTLNSFLLMVIDITVKATRALVFVMVARYLGPDESGVFTVALSYQAIFQAFTMTGIDYLLVREVAKDASLAADYFTHISALKIVLSGISWVVLLVVLLVVPQHSPSTIRIILLLALAILPEGLYEVCRALFVAFQRLVFPAAIAGGVGIVKLTLSYLLLRQGARIESVVLVIVAASVVSLIANLFFIFKKLVRPVWHLRRDLLRTSFLDLVTFAGIGILRVLEYHVTILLLSYISGDHQVGVYNAAYTLVLAVLMASQAYAGGALPVLSRLYAESDYSRLKTFYRMSVQFMGVAALPIALALVRFPSVFVFNVYTLEYIETIPVLQVLSLVILLTLFIAPHACIMLAANLQRWTVCILSTSIVANILTGILLIPRYGAVGASIARVVATAVGAMLYYVTVRTKVVRVSILRLTGFVTVAGGIMIGVGWIIRDASPWLVLLSSGIAYLVSLVLTVVLSGGSRRLALKLFDSSGAPRDA
jgi:O-antigen/teichoic acid export membrane protein